jgi:hypothetical protein
VVLAYDYAPGEERDGVTIKLPWSLAETIAPAVLDWAVPGLREKQIGELLRALPKALRKELMPFPPKIQEIVREFQPSGESPPRRVLQWNWSEALPTCGSRLAVHNRCRFSPQRLVHSSIRRLRRNPYHSLRELRFPSPPC